MKWLTLAVAVVALFVGVVVGAAYYTSVLAENTANYQKLLDELRAENQRLQNQLTSSNNRVGKLESDIKSVQTLLDAAEKKAKELDEKVRTLENQVQKLNEESSAAKRELTSLRAKSEQLKNILSRLENDRVLLSWLRSDPPNQREAARQFWNETRSLTIKSEPNLALTVDRILASLDLYFNWVEKAPQLRGTSRAEIIAWCPLWVDWILTAPPGVDEYTEAIEQLYDEIFLVVIAHIDSLSKVFEG